MLIILFILFFIFLFQAIDDDSRKTVNLSPYKPSERRLSPSSSSSAFSVSSDASYVVQAGKLITQGLEYEAAGQLEESFDLFKAGVDVLLSGVQSKCEYHEVIICTARVHNTNVCTLDFGNYKNIFTSDD